MQDSYITRLLALSLLLGAAHSALAQAPYPARPIRFLVGFPPGGTNDIVARAIAPKLSEYLGQSVVIENRGGANASIATELAARAAPDGYTILLVAPGHATNPALLKLKFDSIKDFAFITLAGGIAEPARGAPVVPAAQREGVDRLLQETPAGQHQLRLVRDRHHGPSFGGAVPVHDRRQMAAHPLQGGRPGGDRPAGRPARDLLRERADGHPSCPRRQAARAGDHRAEAHAGGARDSDGRGVRRSGLRSDHCLRRGRAGEDIARHPRPAAR